MSLLEPPPRRRIAFMLTPLVDVMFLLLIFFMLSSQTAPYSLLSLLAGAGSAAPESTPPAPAASGPAQPQLLVSIGHEFARLNGQRVPLAELPEAIRRLQAAGFATAVVLTTGTATVQDVVTVVEAFKATEFPDIRLMTQAGSP